MTKLRISYLFICSFVLACKGRKTIEKYHGNYPIKEIRYAPPRIEVIPAKGATLKDFIHLNLLDTFKPGIIGIKAKKIFGEPDQENKGDYQSSYEYWYDTAKVELHFGEDIMPSIEIYLKNKSIDNILTPELKNFIKAKAENGIKRSAIRIESSINSSIMSIYLNGIELDYIEWTK